MASGSTSGSVSIQTSSVGVKDTPITVSMRPLTMPKARSVCTARVTPSLSPAPKQWEMTILAPSAVPLKKFTIRVMSEPVELTAAREVVPRNWPTMTESAAL